MHFNLKTKVYLIVAGSLILTSSIFAFSGNNNQFEAKNLLHQVLNSESENFENAGEKPSQDIVSQTEVNSSDETKNLESQISNSSSVKNEEVALQTPRALLQNEPKLKVPNSAFFDEDFFLPEHVKYTYIPKTVIDNSSNLQAQTLPITLPFDTTVGFSSTSLGSVFDYVGVTQPITLEFPDTPSDTLVSSIKFEPAAEFSVSRNGRFVTVTPTRLQRYTNYKLGITNSPICSQVCPENTSSFWMYKVEFRTVASETITYGYSVSGRPLVAYIYGTADANGKKIMLTGATHGEEWHAGGLWMLVDYLNNNPWEMINRNKTLVIVPFVNIDGAQLQQATGGYGSNVRYNSRGVNLNRNFPHGWTGCAICGSGPASEPEVSSLINLVQSEQINHMIAYHNQWPPNGIIFLGDTKNSYTQWWARWVADRTGYPVGVYNGPEVNQPNSSGSVPGDQVVWAERNGVRGLLIEGSYRGVTDWNKNFPMYLALIREF